MTVQELRVGRDAARMMLHRAIALREDENTRLDALLALERQLAVEEACEALENHEAMMVAIASIEKYPGAYGRLCGALAAFLRARGAQPRCTCDDPSLAASYQPCPIASHNTQLGGDTP